MTNKLLIVFALIFTFSLPSNAVLKEKDLGNTLSILRNELTTNYREQERQRANFKAQSERVRLNLFSILSKSNQNALMLYSQKPDYVFDLAYACHEATDQFHSFKRSALPFRTFMEKMNGEVARYDSLISALQTMPTMQLDEKAKIDRNVCLTLAINIRHSILDNQQSLTEYMRLYNMTENRLQYLNDHANKRYSEIQNSIFKNGGDNYFSILSSFGSYLSKTAETVNEKYQPSRKIKSQWDSRMIFGLFIVILFYGIIAITLNIIGIKILMPKRFRTPEFMAKRTCIILATTTVTFAIILGIVKSMTNQNFIAMASNLLVEYAWLLGVILISLLLRVDGQRIKSAFRIYSPLIVVGFLVIAFRIILIPNDLVNLIFPPILLVCTLWQWSVLRRHSGKIPHSDMFYAYVSLIIFIASLICSWAGFTLMSVQALIWWIMQLTCILTLSCLSGWMNEYYEKHSIATKPVTQTWLYHLVYKVAIPLLAIFSILISIYWAADVFNLSELTRVIFTKRFIDVSNFSVSIQSLVMVLSLWFVFSYVSKVSIAFMKYHFEKTDIQTAASRNVMGKNVIQILVWGVWLLVSLSILHVSNTWLVVISGGLSTGVGFASKDIIENIYYGISLMAGRIKIGDWIECDGTRGKVSSISYTSTMIEATDGSIIAFQNSQLFTKNYKNLTRNHGYELSIIPFGVAYGSNVREVCGLIEESVKKLKTPHINKKKAIKTIFTGFGDNSIDFKLLCWVDVTKQVAVESDIRECIYNVLSKNNIEMPYPQRDVYIKNIGQVTSPHVDNDNV